MSDDVVWEVNKNISKGRAEMLKGQLEEINKIQSRIKGELQAIENEHRKLEHKSLIARLELPTLLVDNPRKIEPGDVLAYTGDNGGDHVWTRRLVIPTNFGWLVPGSYASIKGGTLVCHHPDYGNKIVFVSFQGSEPKLTVPPKVGLLGENFRIEPKEAWRKASGTPNYKQLADMLDGLDWKVPGVDYSALGMAQAPTREAIF